MDGTTGGCDASLKDACGEKNKRWRPFRDASYRCVEFHSDSAKRLTVSAMKLKRREFLSLKQGQMTVTEYRDKFI
jgi:hypothetical protein